jgi:hypothetical protein
MSQAPFRSRSGRGARRRVAVGRGAWAPVSGDSNHRWLSSSDRKATRPRRKAGRRRVLVRPPAPAPNEGNWKAGCRSATVRHQVEHGEGPTWLGVAAGDGTLSCAAHGLRGERVDCVLSERDRCRLMACRRAGTPRRPGCRCFRCRRTRCRRRCRAPGGACRSSCSTCREHRRRWMGHTSIGQAGSQ